MKYFVALSFFTAACISLSASAGNKSIVVDGYQIKKAAMSGSCFELVLANPGGRTRSGLLTLVWGSAKKGYVTREPFSMAENGRQAMASCSALVGGRAKSRLNSFATDNPGWAEDSEY